MADSLRLVVLIDGENIPGHQAKSIFEEVATHGKAIVRRVYLPPNFGSWAGDVLHQHAIEPVVRFPYRANKNVMDIALVLDAMDLMYRGREIYDGFCIVSNDSDFTLLATRIQQEGFKVIGLGDERAVDSFIQSCDLFINLEGKQKSIEDAREMLISAVREIGRMRDSEWVSLGAVGNYLRKVDPSFDVRNYGCKKPKELVEKTEHFESRVEEDGLTVYIREKKKE